MSGETMEKWLADANQRITELEAENKRLHEHIRFIQSDDFMPHYYALEEEAERYRKLRNLGCAIPIGFTGQLVNDLHTYRNTVLDSVVDAMEGE